MKSCKAGLKMALFILWSLLCVPPQMILMCFHKGKGAYLIPWIWQNGVRMIFQIQYEVEGMPLQGQQTFFMANHLSYLDIPLLGSVLRASFVAKSEVATWPLFGFLSRLQQTEFLDRQRTAIARETDALAAKIASGRDLIIFPEGTSTSGFEVLPFKSSLFTLALNPGNENLIIQPVTIGLLEVDGHTPRSKDDHDFYAWPREMEMGLPQHLFRFAQTSGARLRLTFHPPFKASDFQDRKILAKACHDSVSNGLGILKAA